MVAATCTCAAVVLGVGCGGGALFWAPRRRACLPLGVAAPRLLPAMCVAAMRPFLVVRVCVVMVLLAVPPAGAVPTSRGRVAAARGVPPMASRQAVCPALAMPDKCEALERLLDEAEAEDALTESLALAVVLLVVARFLVTLLDHKAESSRSVGGMLSWAQRCSLLRLSIVVVSIWQLTRAWNVPSQLVETRLLAIAVALDTSLVLNFWYRDYVTSVAEECERTLCDSMYRPPIPSFAWSRRSRVDRAAGGPPPTCLFSELTGTSVRNGDAAGGPYVLRGQLLLLVRDHEFVSDGLGTFIKGYMTGPTGAIWGLVIACSYVFLALFGGSRDFLRSREPTSDVRVPLFLRVLPRFSSFAHAHFVCLNGHQGDDAVAVLEDHLPACWTSDTSPLEYYAPHSGSSTARFILSTYPGWLHEAVAHQVLGCAHRLPALAHVVYSAGVSYERMDSGAEIRRLEWMWSSATARAPLDTLVINPAACPTICFRVHCLRTGLGAASERFASLLLFGLRALVPGVTPLRHGYWWARSCMYNGAFDAFEWWTRVSPEAARPTMEVPDASALVGSEAVHEAAASAPATVVSSPSGEAAADVLASVGTSATRDTASGVSGSVGPVTTHNDAAHPFAAADSSTAGRSEGNEPGAVGASATHDTDTSEPETAGPSATDDAADPLRRLWRSSPHYSQPLRDDWGSNDTLLPPVWHKLVADPGGLTSAAAFGLQAWMVVADLGIDDLGDLYLTLGLPSQIGERHLLDWGDGVGASSVLGGGGAGAATAQNLEEVLQRRLAAAVSIARLVQGRDVSALPSSAVDEETTRDWPRVLPAPPQTVPLAAGADQALLDALRRFVPCAELPQALHNVYKPLVGGDAGDDYNHQSLLDVWHERWRGVLAEACELYSVGDVARDAVLDVPLRGFYPAMRVALDALSGHWEPLAAADLSQRGYVVPGWPAPILPRLHAVAACLKLCMWHPTRAHPIGLMASVLLSQTEAEGARFRELLRLDVSTKTLLPPGAAPLEAATALASVLLTGYAITLDEGGDGAEVRPTLAWLDESADDDSDRQEESILTRFLREVRGDFHF